MRLLQQECCLPCFTAYRGLCLCFGGLVFSVTLCYVFFMCLSLLKRPLDLSQATVDRKSRDGSARHRRGDSDASLVTAHPRRKNDYADGCRPTGRTSGRERE